MPSNSPEPNPPQPGLLARLRGMVHSRKAPVPEVKNPDDPRPGLDSAAPVDVNMAIPLAQPVLSAESALPVATEVTPMVQEAVPLDQAETAIVPIIPLAGSESPESGNGSPPVPTAPVMVMPGVEPVATVEAEEAPIPADSQRCAFCGSPRVGARAYCDDCGLVFSAAPPAKENQSSSPQSGNSRLQGRYELGASLGQRGDVARFQALDHGAGNTPQPVVILRGPLPLVPEAAPIEDVPLVEVADNEDEEILPDFEMPMLTPAPTAVGIDANKPAWPSLAWERALLEKAAHPALPGVLDSFAEGESEYLVEEAPGGQPLWDAWDEEGTTAEQRFGLLKQLAEGLRRLHEAGATIEALRPDIVMVASGRARLADLSDLLPLPLPPNPPIRATYYSAPELALASDQADARATLYSFGAMVYALHVGRELTEMDFDKQGAPKPFTPRFPDIHPLFGRLVSKTFCKDVHGRFPTDEAIKEDPSGFTELIRVLDVCGRTLDNVRLEIAAWTTTGMVRTGNEDAFALLHGIESRQDDMTESALVLLADGMGGYEAGEVAASLAIASLRRNLLQQKMFACLAGDTVASQAAFDVKTCQHLIETALREANKEVHTAPQRGIGRRGMGCTAEVVYVNGQNVVVGHIGDSRTYLLHEGKLVQMTRDQTLVNRLVELGQLKPEEAENHPRRSELQQALGGRSEVVPLLYHGTLKAGDWIVVCSDGLSNHIKPIELKQMLQSEAASAEMAARRLVNFANIMGATDNATVVAIRAT